MPLKLIPTITQLSKSDLEAYIMTVQARRMVAAVTYFKGKNAKHESAIAKDDKRIAVRTEQLGKKLIQLEKLILSIETLARTIEEITTDRDQHHEHLQTFDTDADETED